MNHILVLNGIVGLLSFLSAGTIIYTLLKDKEGKTPIFIMFVLTICTGNFVTGCYRISQALGLQGNDLFSKILSSAYPMNDVLLIISGFLLSYMIMKYHIGDVKQDRE